MKTFNAEHSLWKLRALECTLFLSIMQVIDLCNFVVVRFLQVSVGGRILPKLGNPLHFLDVFRHGRVRLIESVSSQELHEVAELEEVEVDIS